MKKTAQHFDLRNKKKKSLEFFCKSKNTVRIGQIWRYYEGMNLGREISKAEPFKRPCIILNNKIGRNLSLVVPLTSRKKPSKNNNFMLVYNHKKYHLKMSRAIINQIKVIDHKRLAHKLTHKEMPITLTDHIIRIYKSLI